MFVEEEKLPGSQRPNLQIQFAPRNPGHATCRLRQSGITKGTWALGAIWQPEEVPPPPSVSAMKRTTGIVAPVPHSRLLALGPFAGRGSQCCAPRDPYLTVMTMRSARTLLKRRNRGAPRPSVSSARPAAPTRRTPSAVVARAKTTKREWKDKRWGIRPTPYGRTADGAPVALS